MIGAVLAGGAGSRMGERGKASAQLAGRPLVTYPVAALAPVCRRLAVVCKPETELPALAGAERWDEPREPSHPLTGIVHALERARAPVLVCAGDMPYVTTDACRTLLAGARAGSALAVVAVAAGVLQPLLGVYTPAALELLAAAGPGAPLTRAIESLEPRRVALPARLVRSVNTPEQLAEAECELR